MLVRLVVITLCAALVAGELQCSGPGRYSTAPGMCTNEYYTCNRDVNKEYVAYVLNCPGNTLFNERTRKCSSSKAVSCNPPPHTTPSGQIKVTPSRRQKLTSQQTSSWISRPSYGYKLTTLKQPVEHRKPGRLPWITPRPYLLHTVAMTTKPQKNQWRIRTSTKKTTPATSTRTYVLPAKIMIRGTTHSSIRQKERKTSKNVTKAVQKTTAQEVYLSTSPVYQQTKEIANLATSTRAAHLSELLITSSDKNENITATSVLLSTPTNPVPPLSFQAVTTRNIITRTTTPPTHTTVKMKPVSDAPLNVLCDQQTIQINPGFVTHPFIIPTSPQTLNVENVYDTTPEVIVKINKDPIPFMDSLESSEQNSDMEIVHVDFKSSLNKVTNPMKTELGKHKNTPLKYITYFFDTDIHPKFNQRLVDRIANSSQMSNKKSKQKTQQKKQRQPK